jgi:hypothetical protein
MVAVSAVRSDDGFATAAQRCKRSVDLMDTAASSDRGVIQALTPESQTRSLVTTHRAVHQSPDLLIL